MPESRLKQKLQQLKLSEKILTCGRDEPAPEGNFLRGDLAQEELSVYVPEDMPGAQDILRLILTLAEPDRRAENIHEFCRRLLTERLPEEETAKGIRAYRIASRLPRCVLVFRLRHAGEGSAYDLLKDVIPMQDADVLADISPCTAALIKDVSDENTLDEVVQFAQALQETLANDTDCDFAIGIGNLCETVQELPEGYSAADRALELGKMFCPGEEILVYERLVPERFLAEIPKEIREKYCAMLADRLADTKVFSEEMLYTIDMFFKCDLNISEASRRLYAHRNTLIYRLNSVQRATGLDLRSFRDAMTFKILMDLSKCTDPTKQEESDL